MWLTKSGASIWSNASRSALPSCASKKRRTNALLCSADIEGPPCRPALFSDESATYHDATRGGLAHRSKPYSPKCLEEGFCEIRVDGVLGSSHGAGHPRLFTQVPS